MYLICCPNVYAKQMVDNLAEIGVEGVPLNILDLSFDLDRLNFIKEQIDAFDYVLVSSPAAIDFLAPAIVAATTTTFITVGTASANKIKSYNANINVIHPEEGSGKEALFVEKLRYLDLSHKKILVIVSDGENSILPPNINEHNATIVEVYKRKLLELDPVELEQHLHSEKLRGIVITSSGMADWLFEEAAKINCVGALKDSLFIVLHPQIEKHLLTLGSGRILVTESTDRSSVAKLIRNLYG